MGWSERMAEALNRKPKQWEQALGIPEQRAHEEARRRQEARDELARGDEDPLISDMREYGGPATYVPAPNVVREQAEVQQRASIEGKAAADSIRDEHTPDGIWEPTYRPGGHPGLTDRAD